MRMREEILSLELVLSIRLGTLKRIGRLEV